MYTTEIKCYSSFYIICVGSAFYFFSPYIYILECTCNRIAKWDSAGHVHILPGGERLQQIARRQPNTQTKKGNLSFSGKKGKENNIRSPDLNQKIEVLFVCLLTCVFILFHFFFYNDAKGFGEIWGHNISKVVFKHSADISTRNILFYIWFPTSVRRAKRND